MKKLNKVKKDKIKKGLVTALNIIGYICIGLTLFTGIALGVNSCNKSEDNVINVALNNSRSNIKYSNDDYLNTLTNYDLSLDAINTTKNSVYYFNANYSYSYDGIKFLSSYYNSENQLVYSNYGVYLVNLTSNTVDYYQGSYISAYNNRFNIGSPSRYTTIFYDSEDKLLLVFEDNRYWFVEDGTGDYYGCISFFNDMLVYVGNTFTSESYGNDYLSLNYNSYKVQVDNNWVDGGQTYLYPFVLPQYLEDYRVMCPVYTISSSNNILSYYNYVSIGTFNNKKGGLFINTYLSNTTTKWFNFVTNNYSQYLGYPTYADSITGYYFGTYCGCYKQSNTYNYFLGYSYLFNDIYSNYGSTYVEGSLNVSFNAYNLFNLLAQNNSALLFSNAYLIYDGSAYSSIRVNYQPVISGEPWFVSYVNDLGSTPSTNFYNPMVYAQFIRYNHFEMKRAIEHFYNNSEFTKLNAPYVYDNPYSDIETGGGSISSSGLGSAMDLIGSAFNAVANVLNLQIFGAFTLGTLIFVPLVVTIILFVIKMFKR